MRDGVGSVVGTWFSNNICLKVGNGACTLFWFDRWVGEVPLQVRLRRLSDLSENKFLIIAQCFSWDGMREGRRGSGEGD